MYPVLEIVTILVVIFCIIFMFTYMTIEVCKAIKRFKKRKWELIDREKLRKELLDD